MSKAFEMISESLNEIIQDFEKNQGKNLNRDVYYKKILLNENMTLKKFKPAQYCVKKLKIAS